MHQNAPPNRTGAKGQDAKEQTKQNRPGGFQPELGEVNHQVGNTHHPDGIGTQRRTQGIQHKAAKEEFQKDELAQQKLTIEQAAEEATKLIEADAKAEIDAVNSSGGAAQ